MAAFNKYQCFVEDIGEEQHSLGVDTLKLCLSNTAPDAAADTTYPTHVAEISAGNGYTAGGNEVLNDAWSQTGGTASLTGDDVTFTASGGAIAQFRYVILYNTVSNKLIGWWDNGSAVDLADGNSFTVDFGASILQLS